MSAGIIRRSLPSSRRTSVPIPAWIAPVFIVTPRKPPMTMMNSATSIAPKSVPVL
jgi:hypothetical protein